MRTSSFSFALGVSAAAALVAGCGASQLSTGTARVIRQSGVLAVGAGRGASWMAPEAKHKNLLYISDFYGVHVFSYPQDVHVGDIYGFASPAGLCSDQAGHVFVTDPPTYHLYEYAHGSTKRLKTLYDNYVDFHPFDCSVDPTSGNVAVASQDARYVVVFPKAKERPKVYYESVSNTYMFYCAYDNKGDLFVDDVGKQPHFYIGELPKNAKQFSNYRLDRRITNAGGIQFDGKHVVLEDLRSLIAYRLRFSGSRAIIVGTTPLSGAKDVNQYWLQGRTLIGPDLYGDVYFWRYPEGGAPIKSIHGFTEPFGSTVSVSP